jgi:hypothetical protein
MMGFPNSSLRPLEFANRAIADEPPVLLLSQCNNWRPGESPLGHEPPRRSLAAVTGLHPIPAAPGRAWGGG